MNEPIHADLCESIMKELLWGVTLVITLVYVYV